MIELLPVSGAMAFPLSMTGKIHLCGDRLSTDLVGKRIADALRKETAEYVQHVGDTIRFNCDIEKIRPRPGGNLWILATMDGGEFKIYKGECITISYCISVRAFFRKMAVLSLILALPGIFLLVVPGIMSPTPWLIFSLLTFLWIFGGNYMERRIRFAFWLRKVVKSDTPYVARSLRLMEAGD